MFEEIKQHNALVRDQIYKGFAGGEELLEKAHNEGDIHPNGKWVWTKLPSGKYDWRVRKDGSSKKPEKHTHEYRMEDAYEYVKNSKQHSQVKYAANSIIDGNDKKSVMNRLSASGVSDASVRESVYAFAAKLADEAISDAKKKYKKITSIDDVPDADFKRITKFLQTKDPESSNDQRHLEPEGMTDKELDMFRTVAEYFRFNNGQLSDRVRKNVGKWANLALEEQASRRKAKKVDAEKAEKEKDEKAVIERKKKIEAVQKILDDSRDVVAKNGYNTGYILFGDVTSFSLDKDNNLTVYAEGKAYGSSKSFDVTVTKKDWDNYSKTAYYTTNWKGQSEPVTTNEHGAIYVAKLLKERGIQIANPYSIKLHVSND